MKGRKLLVLLMATMITVTGALAAGCSSDSSSGGGESGETTESKEEEKSEYGVGETATVNNVDITLAGAVESMGDEYFGPADGNKFEILEFEIANNSDEEVAVSSIMCFEAYCDDYSIDVSYDGELAPEAEDKSTLDGTVAAGKKMNGIIAYEVPTDFERLEVDVNLDVWSDEAVKFVITQ